MMRRLSGVVKEKDVQRWLAQGFGQGELEKYTPWIRKHDISSIGQSREVPGVKIARTHHLLSKLEYWVFIILEARKDVIDIREQFPLLDRRLVQSLASSMGVKPPRFFGSQTPYVMTTDFLLTVESSEVSHNHAVAVKYSESLHKKRTLEILEIERSFWETYGIPWRLITEREIPPNLPRNLHWLRIGALAPRHLDTDEHRKDFLEAFSFRWRPDLPLRSLLSAVAKDLGLRYDESCRLFQHMGWHLLIDIDLQQCISLADPLILKGGHNAS